MSGDPWQVFDLKEVYASKRAAIPALIPDELEDKYYFIKWRIRKMPKVMVKNPMHELRYGGEIYALSPDLDVLYYLKAKATFKKLVRYPEMLHIFYEGKDEWIFDKFMDEKLAAKIVAGCDA